jgi:hypothetical protein
LNNLGIVYKNKFWLHNLFIKSREDSNLESSVCTYMGHFHLSNICELFFLDIICPFQYVSS